MTRSTVLLVKMKRSPLQRIIPHVTTSDNTAKMKIPIRVATPASMGFATSSSSSSLTISPTEA